MKILERGDLSYAICPRCCTKMQYNKSDLHWTIKEPDIFTIFCPVCGESIKVKGEITE